MDDCLDTWDVRDDAREVLVLVVGELVSNAVRHGRGTVELYVNTSATVLRIEVSDQGGGQPRIRPVEHSGPRAGGWGLRLVDQLVDMWGTTVQPGRTVVWVQHAIRPTH
jgi:serine/threonine-protein kinase RsbW